MFIPAHNLSKGSVINDQYQLVVLLRVDYFVQLNNRSTFVPKLSHYLYFSERVGIRILDGYFASDGVFAVVLLLSQSTLTEHFHCKLL